MPLRPHLSSLWHSKIARSVAVMASGTAGAQAMAMLVAPLTTRLYGPEAYGLQGVFVSILAVITSLSAMMYPMAIPLPKQEREALAIVRFSAIVALIVATVCLLALVFSVDWIAKVTGAEAIQSYLYLLPIGVLSTAWSQIASQWLIRKKAFKETASSTLSNAVLVNGTRVIAGFTGPVASTLIWIFIAGQALLAARMSFLAKRLFDTEASTSDQPPERHADWRETAYKYRDFPLYRAPQDLLNAASRSLPILLLSSLFGPVSAGLYALATQIVGAPSVLIGSAVTNAFYPDVAERMQRQEDIASLLVKATATLALVGLVPFAVLLLFGPSLFAWLFGESWRQAGHYCQWLAVFYYFNFINKPAVAAIPVLSAQRGLLIYEIVSTTVKIGCLATGFVWLHSDIAAVALFSISGALAYIWLIYWVIQTSKREDIHAKASR